MVNQVAISLNKRDEAFDIIKGFCILLMIVGHCPINEILGNVIYSFHMPFFFFIAGFFFRQYGLRRAAITGIRRLLVPFAFVFLFCIAVAHIFEAFECFSNVITSRVDYNNPINNILLMGPGFPVWFLIALFWCKIFFIPIRKIKNDVVVFIIVFFVAIIAANLHDYIKLPLVFFPSLSALGFFAVGRFLAIQNFYYNEKIWTILPLLLASWIICLSTGKQLHIVYCEYGGFYILDILGALGVFVSLYFIVKNCTTKAVLWSFFKWCGVNSLIVLCVHTIEFNFVDFDAVKRKLLPFFLPYELYVLIALRLIFDLSIAYVLTKSKVVKRYIFFQND